MSAPLRKSRALLSAYYAYMTEFRAELMLWMLSGIFPFIIMGLWMQVPGLSSTQYNYGPAEIARYFLAVFLVRQFTMVWAIWEFEMLVNEGKLSSQLVQPLDPVWRIVAGHVAERVARLPFIVLLVAIFFALYPKALFVPAPADAALFVLVTALAFVLRFAVSYTMAMAAFWVERASAMEAIWFLGLTVFSGMIAPLSLYPPLARKIILCTPFPYTIYFPASILIGRWNAHELLQGLAVTAAWTVALIILNRLLWRAGLRQYSGMGA